MKLTKVVLSPYERSILSGTKDSRGNTLTAEKRTQAIINAMLNCTVCLELEDGTTVEPTIDELLISRSIQAELERPKGLETVERLMKIRGEQDDKATDVVVSVVDKDLAKRAIQ